MKTEDPSADQSSPAAKSGRRWARLAIRIGGSAIILSALVAFVSPRELAAAAGRLTPQLMLPALSLYLLLHVLGTLKWQIMINAAGAGLSLRHSARCYYAGLFANTFLISLVGGDVVRAGMALRQARSKAGLVVGSLADRLFDVAGLIAITLAGALWMPGLVDYQSRQLFRGLVLGAGLLAVAAVALRVLVPARRLPFKARRLLVRVRVATHAVVRRPHLVLLAVGLGIVLQASLVLMNAWLGAVCGLHLPLWAWFFAWPLAKIASMVPVSLGGLGVREAALVSLLVPFKADAASVVAAGLAFEAVIIGGGLISGLISLLLASGVTERFAWPGVVAAGRIQEPSTVSEQ
jgi:glycosyltransferase 2 family protein